jgi:hypothetical protein
MGKKKQERQQGASVGQVFETYLDGAGQEAIKQARGAGPQLKGSVQEVMFRDKLNAEALLKGRMPQARLSPTQNDQLADVIDGVRSYQVKDVVSVPGQRDLARRVAGGQYDGATLVGSPETVAAAGKRGIKMESTGVSSRTATRAADNAGAKVPNRDLLKSNMTDIGHAGVASGVVGGGLSAVGAAWTHRGKLAEGEVGEFVVEVGVEGVKGAAVSGVKTVAALGMKEAAKAGARQLGNETLKRAAGSNPATAVAFGVVELGVDMARYAKGDIHGGELKERACGTVGSTGGAMGGAAAGAALGSVVPGVGTAIGAAIGGVLGSMSGGALGRWFGK